MKEEEMTDYEDLLRIAQVTHVRVERNLQYSLAHAFGLSPEVWGRAHGCPLPAPIWGPQLSCQLW